ncbi:hypothetical protein [Endozoicomonas acroporae]|uniref:hypothetical protein n=1 Tax=Endozoicomonas acroporae TaxID=1701104 RepID=UPI003D799828
MVVMKPFQLVFELGSNISLRDSAIHLDGLLSNVCFRHTGCLEKALSMLDDLLLFDQEHGIYHASALAFGVSPEQSIVARSRHYVGAMRSGRELRDDLILPTQTTRAGKEQYRKITVAGGPEKLRLNKYQAYYSPYVVFHGVGDIARIDRLVQFHCCRIGVNANSGGGAINQMAIKEIQQDYSFIDVHGQVARNLPLSWLQANRSAMENDSLNSLPGEPLPVRAPYWYSHHRFSTTDAVAVEKIRRVVI